MVRSLALGVVAVLAAVAPAAAHAASSANHTVSVVVSAIDDVAVTGGNVTLNITTTAAETNSATGLTWSTNQSSRKITVATSLSTIRFPLTVAPGSVSGGTGSSTLTLSTTAQDIVTGISLTDGSCTLTYSASAARSAGTGTDTHTVTYTITAA